jgi:hypothetical protein
VKHALSSAGSIIFFTLLATSFSVGARPSFLVNFLMALASPLPFMGRTVSVPPVLFVAIKQHVELRFRAIKQWTTVGNQHQPTNLAPG